METRTRSVDDLFSGLPEAPAEIVPRPRMEVSPHERLKKIEDDILKKAMITIDEAMSWRDIDPGEKNIPPDWMDMDPDEAVKRLRVANAAWMNKKEAPVGLNIAKDVLVGIIKARATEKAAPMHTLNIMHVQMTAPMPQFDVIQLEAENDK